MKRRGYFNKSQEHALNAKGISTKERKYTYKHPWEGILTEKELLWDKVTYERLEELIKDPDIEVISMRPSENNYGEFWFITVLDKRDNKAMTFYGLGFNWSRNKYMTNFKFYQSNIDTEKNLEFKDKKAILAKMYLEYRDTLEKEQNFKEEPDYEFEMLADMADEDYAYSQLKM